MKKKETKTQPSKPADQPERVTSLTVKVPDSLRIHWLIESKRRGTSLSAIIVKYLSEELGTPN